jgi:hypothetical protein
MLIMVSKTACVFFSAFSQHSATWKFAIMRDGVVWAGFAAILSQLARWMGRGCAGCREEKRVIICLDQVDFFHSCS